MPTLQDDALANEIFYESISQPNMTKRATDVVNDYIRLKLREEGVARRILPPIKLSNTDLDRQYDTSLPAKIVDMEIDSPAAVSASFEKFPDQCYIRGQRFRVTMARILSPWFTADVNELRTHVMDIRQVMSDNSLKDMMAVEDSSFLSAVGTAMGGSQGSTGAFSGGAVQWAQLPAGISRNAFADSFKPMPQMDGHLRAEKVLLNNVTIYELYKWGRDEMGGDISQDIAKDGWTLKNFMGVDLEVSIKRTLIPDYSMFYFGNPQFMGRFYTLDDTTMYIETKAFFISWFSYWCGGLTIANPYSLTRSDFVG